MLHPDLRDRINDVLGRLFALSEPLTNARAFRALLEDLHRRDLAVVKEPHVSAITMVRAGILRGAIGSVMMALDPADWRGNRVSLGQIFDLLKDAEVAEEFNEVHKPTIESLRLRYEALTQGATFLRTRALRNKSISHNLLSEREEMANEYADIFSLHDAAEHIVIDLHECSGRGTPQFVQDRQHHADHAKIFWDTYFAGMHGTAAQPL